MTTPSSNPTESLGALRGRLRQRVLDSEIDPRDADFLLGHALDRNLAYLISHSDDSVDPSTAAAVVQMVARRLMFEPLQYICGYTEFFGRRFGLDPRVLIPRPETEILVETAIRRLTAGARVLDVGTGSGCIAISVELERPGALVVGTDRSLAALAVARRNGAKLSSHAAFLGADFLAPLRGSFDLIVANPPYIPAGVVETLAPEVRDYEPRSALTPGPRGTEALEALLLTSGGLLRSGGHLMLEIGFDQAAEIRNRAEGEGWVVEDIVADLSNIPRVVVLSRP